jgi:hypothetical protein
LTGHTHAEVLITMSSFRNELIIDRPNEDVFTYLADFENVPHWNYAITRTTKLTPGPSRVGTEYSQLRSIPRPGSERFTVVAVKAPSLLEIEGQLGHFAARLRYELKALRPARTLLVNDVTLSVPGPLSVLSPLLGRQVGDAVASNLSVLRGLLEEPQPAHSRI